MQKKLTSVVAILFLACQVTCTALPNPESDASPIKPAAAEVQFKTGISKRAAPESLFKRDRTCAIVNNGDSSITAVNCRSGPGTTYPVLATLDVGTTWPFKCRKAGQCIDGDCGWDYSDTPPPACYVWEVYTDTNCSPNLLPTC